LAAIIRPLSGYFQYQQHQSLELVNSNLVSTDSWRDLISGEPIAEGQSTLELRPYQTAWLSNA
jgi:sucrose phosphorylase